jgi:hypothetical protein
MAQTSLSCAAGIKPMLATCVFYVDVEVKIEDKRVNWKVKNTIF